MAKNDCPSWFPLPIHVTPPQTLAHWIRALTFRMGVLRAPQSNEWKSEKYFSVVVKDDGTDWEEPSPSSFLAIREVTPYEAFKLAQLHDVPDSQEAKRVASLRGWDAYTPESMEIKARSGNLDGLNDWWDEFQYRVPVFLDLSVDDKTLISDFEFWLTLMRGLIKEAGDKGMAAPIPINNESLRKWHEARLLAAYDLLNWREISGASYSDAAIASWLWPDSGPLSDGAFVDRAERFRKVTKPLLDKVFDWHTVERLERAWAGQLMHEKIERERKKITGE